MSGIETDAHDRVVAYWMLDHHPKDYILRGNTDFTPKRVEAEQVLHVYMQERFSDCRGYPWGASALNVTERYRTYDDVELERKIMSSSKGGYFKKPRYAGDEEDPFDPEQDLSEAFIPMSPGEYVQVPEGWDIQETTPAASDTNYEVYKREQLSGLAVAFGFAVELVSMNWRYLASDRQYRALMLEVVRLIESIQYHMMVFQFCQPIWERFVSEAFANGLWKPEEGKDLEDYFDVEWITPKRGYIHPVQDVTAVMAAISAGLDSRKRAVGAIGEDVEDIDDENAEDMRRSKSMGLPYSVLGLNAPTQVGGLLGLGDAYGIAVRAGLITPQLDDEKAARQAAGLPALSVDAINAWTASGGVRGPITLKEADPTPIGSPSGSSPNPALADLLSKINDIYDMMSTT